MKHLVLVLLLLAARSAAAQPSSSPLALYPWTPLATAKIVASDASVVDGNASTRWNCDKPPQELVLTLNTLYTLTGMTIDAGGTALERIEVSISGSLTEPWRPFDTWDLTAGFPHLFVAPGDARRVRVRCLPGRRPGGQIAEIQISARPPTVVITPAATWPPPTNVKITK
jgi:hypothetical protein